MENQTTSNKNFNEIIHSLFDEAYKRGSMSRDPDGNVMRSYMEVVDQIENALTYYIDKDTKYEKEYAAEKQKIVEKIPCDDRDSKPVQRYVMWEETNGKLKALNKLCIRWNIFPGEEIQI